MPSISGISHVSFSVNDPERSARWYQDVLGFAHLSEGEGERFHRIRLRHPDSGVTVTLTGHQGASGDRFDEVRTGLDHLAFSVGPGDIEAWKRRLEEHGVDHSEVKATGGGGALITVRDPDNIQLEVFAAPLR